VNSIPVKTNISTSRSFTTNSKSSGFKGASNQTLDFSDVLSAGTKESKSTFNPPTKLMKNDINGNQKTDFKKNTQKSDNANNSSKIDDAKHNDTNEDSQIELDNNEEVEVSDDMQISNTNTTDNVIKSSNLDSKDVILSVDSLLETKDNGLKNLYNTENSKNVENIENVENKIESDINNQEMSSEEIYSALNSIFEFIASINNTNNEVVGNDAKNDFSIMGVNPITNGVIYNNNLLGEVTISNDLTSNLFDIEGLDFSNIDLENIDLSKIDIKDLNLDVLKEFSNLEDYNKKLEFLDNNLENLMEVEVLKDLTKGDMSYTNKQENVDVNGFLNSIKVNDKSFRDIESVLKNTDSSSDNSLSSNINSIDSSEFISFLSSMDSTKSAQSTVLVNSNVNIENQTFIFDENTVANDLYTAIKDMNKVNLMQIKFRLTPKELGEMTIDISQLEEISKIKITVANKETFNVIRGNLDKIIEQLKDNGLVSSGSSIDIEMESSNNEGFNFKEYDPENEKGYERESRENIEEETNENKPSLNNSTGSVNILA
jgi:flagellar hook-length control protein FliK